jgi:hypothetical protein
MNIVDRDLFTQQHATKPLGCRANEQVRQDTMALHCSEGHCSAERREAVNPRFLIRTEPRAG